MDWVINTSLYYCLTPILAVILCVFECYNCSALTQSTEHHRKKLIKLSKEEG